MSKITVMIFENVEDELCEKIKAVVRSASQTEEIEFSTDDVTTFGDYTISFSRRKVFYGDREISLTKKEFEILAYFIHNSNRVLTYDQIYERVWGEVPYGSIQKLIAYHVKNLRQKLQNAPFDFSKRRDNRCNCLLRLKPNKEQ